MHYFTTFLIFMVSFSSQWFLMQATLAAEKRFSRIGVILDQTSRRGKEAKVAIEIAVQDFNNETNQPCALYLQNSRGKPIHAAIAAKELIEEHNVKAILGAHTWEEASAITELINESVHDIPFFLSLASTTPLQATDQLPFVIQSVPTQSTQMNAVAAVLQSWGITQVTLMYETSNLTSSSASITTYLTWAFHKTDCTLTNILSFTSGVSSINKELEVLKMQQRKVFVIHTSLELGIRLYQTAKNMNMTGDGYLWIATTGITDVFHSVSSTKISQLKGMIGVKSYFTKNTPDFLNFRKIFRQRFHHDYPEEEQDEPGIFAMQGYNAMKLLAQNVPENFNHMNPIVETTVEIVYVIGNGYHSVYWTEGFGFSETVEDDTNIGATAYTHSLENLKQALFPMQPWYANRRRRNLADSSENRMRVGVPGHSLFKQFVNVEFDPEKNQNVFSGFVIAVFDEMMKQLNQPFEYIAFNGSYDELMIQIPLKNFDAVAGDVAIRSSRLDYLDFTQPYTESGLEMVVPVRSRLSNQPWLFLKPFTAKMWWLIVAITLYNGFIIWLIERAHCQYLRGSIINQIGVVIWLAFTTLFTLRGDKLHSNLSRMAVVVWLFVALIVTQSYTASFTSMLTAQRLEPTITNVEVLRNMNATVGYCNGSLVNHYLKDVLGFNSFKVKSYNSTRRYAEALYSGEIAAIFLEVPAAKVFLSQYCKSFIRTGETFKVGGYGFAFPWKYTLLSEVNKALTNVSESGKLKKFEDTYLTSEKCVDDKSFPNEGGSLSPRSFSILFELTGGTSTVALVIYIFTSVREFKKCNPELTNFFKLMSSYIKDQMRRSSRVFVNAESS